MHYMLLLLLVLCSGNLYAQEESSGKGIIMDQATGTIHYFPQHGEVQGSPYLVADWLPGVLVLRSGKEQPENFIRFLVYGNKFIINKNDTAFEVGSGVKEVRLLHAGKKGDTLVFRRGFAGVPPLNQESFVQVLASGTTSLVKVHRADLHDVTEYNNANRIKRFRLGHDYGICKNGVIEKVRLNKSELLRVLADKKNETEDFLSRNKLSGKDEESWVQALRWYNTQFR